MEKLLEYCRTQRQRETIDAIIKYGDQAKAARALGINRHTVKKSLKRVKGYAANAHGYNPDRGLIDTGSDMGWTGTSAYYEKTPERPAQWVKYKPDAEQQAEALQATIDALKEEIPREKAVKAPKTTVSRLLNQYTLTDYHVGALSWHEETANDDWDTDIAEKMLVDWFGVAIDSAPAAETAIFAQLGDFLHFDGLESITPSSGHQLDTDSRFQRIIRVVIRALRKIIRMLLEKHDRVHVIMAEGNHDLAASAWLREMLFAFYEDEPRITVDRTASPYYCYEHGKTSLFFHHGHRKRMNSVADVFAAQFREVFGRTKHSYAHLGHLHHDKLEENNLMTIEQHRTIAAPDAYAAKGGWISGRGAKVITYDKEFGEVGRCVISPDMVNSR